MEAHSSELLRAVALLGAAVIAVPIFKRLGLGAVIGYLAAGLAIGPAGLRVFTDPDTILSVAEFGVVLLLFVIGLELKPSRLWTLRKDIFGLGAAQVILCGAALMGAGILAGLSPAVAFVAASGLTLSSTAIVMQILEERGETTAPHGQKTFAILLVPGPRHRAAAGGRSRCWRRSTRTPAPTCRRSRSRWWRSSAWSPSAAISSTRSSASSPIPARAR